MSAPADRFEVRLGFIPLNDMAPLAVAQERGLFEHHGLRVSLSREPSWANVRDKAAYGLLDGAHMLTPMPITAALDHSGPAVITPMALALNSNAITVSNELFEMMGEADPLGMTAPTRTAAPLAKALPAWRASRGRKPNFAMVFPSSAQNYELRYWLAAGGVDPERDVNLVVVPPPRMFDMLRDGRIDGYCAGAPWNAMAEAGGLGRIVIAGWRFWGLKPEKTLGVSAPWAQREPEALQALLRALLEAAIWADAAENREELTAILSMPAYVGESRPTVRWSLYADDRRFLIFHRSAANFPWISHGLWFARQMARWGQADESAAANAVRAVFRPDLYREAAQALGVNAPLDDVKVEGAHDAPWTVPGSLGPIDMLPDRFFDGTMFDALAANAEG
jgi:nitrate/nitrite transport system substrate-binding protein